MGDPLFAPRDIILGNKPLGTGPMAPGPLSIRSQTTSRQAQSEVFFFSCGHINPQEKYLYALLNKLKVLFSRHLVRFSRKDIIFYLTPLD